MSSQATAPPAAADWPAAIAEATANLAGVTVRTPVMRSPELDAMTGARVWIKPEMLQVTGSFKFRGAYNAVTRAASNGARTIVAYSSGNHACAVAEAARRHAMDAVVLMPADAPRHKAELARRAGARIIEYDRYNDDREALARALCEDSHTWLVPSADSPDIVAGAATAVRELAEETDPLDCVVVPVGGGGLLAGAAVALDAAVRLVGVEPSASDDLRQSVAAGSRVRVPVGRSCADGLLLASVAPLAWEVAGARVRPTVVSEAAITAAMRFATDYLRLVCEPSAAVGLAALLDQAGESEGSWRGRTIGLILTGGNVGYGRMSELLAHR